jgi:predicted DNA-binding protein
VTKRGRPALNEAGGKAQPIKVPASDDLRQRVKSAAIQAGKSQADWCREAIEEKLQRP